ncbi:L1 protein [Omikronpapillomavirus 1]|uniref:Major capsid protein L1 n=3 Tax=Phocoena spinipinnis papillomavirus TaxID=82676 RepID=Q77AL2_PSPVP|nr:L1 protein [Omikronpapillomavirus 1]CAB92319.1 L1 capsid protein [Omikronpapillomavirus 1]CAC80276.1 L1 protein [Omikronpapillomavirus 1]
MASTSYWLPSTDKLFLPPPAPVSKILSTDAFVTRLDIFYHAGTGRQLLVGHPYFDVLGENDKLIAKKVSGNQYRAARFTLPDPNRFALQDPTIYDPDRERLVWACRGLQVGRGLPLGGGTTGHPYYNKAKDTENPNSGKYPKTGEGDNRQNVSFDPKQVQMVFVGCSPCVGEHWDKVTSTCADQVHKEGDCPAIELVSSHIQDGDMCDIGFGAINNKTLQESRSEVPLDIVSSICKHPDILQMSNDPFGNSMWFFAKREQMYVRHMWARRGTVSEKVPDPANGGAHAHEFYLSPKNAEEKAMASTIYSATPSGSLITSDGQLFNRPYWIQTAQGKNNGICWGNEVFVTVADNTRSTNITISVKDPSKNNAHQGAYEADHFKIYTRHMEEYEFSFIFQLCKVPLTPEVLAQLNNMNSKIIEKWNVGFATAAPASSSLAEHYRYINSLATKCPPAPEDTEEKDPYEGESYWNIDLSEAFSSELDSFPLGRKFLYQASKSIRAPSRSTTKRPAAKSPVKHSSKRARR